MLEIQRIYDEETYLVDQLIGSLKEYHYVVSRTTNTTAIPNLPSIPTEKEDFKRYCEMIEKNISEKNLDISQNVFKEYGLLVKDNFWKNLTQDDIIEAYSMNCTRLYISPNFFRYNTYPLQTLFKYTWFDLYDRDEFINRRCLEIAQEILSGVINNVLELEMPTHVVKEKFSEEKRSFSVTIRRIAPVYNADGDLKGFATINRLKVLDN